MDYSELENNFDCACQNAIKGLSEQFKVHYLGAGPAKLEIFFGLIKTEFERTESMFITEYKIIDKEALQRIKAIAKNYARKCLDDYGKIN